MAEFAVKLGEPGGTVVVDRAQMDAALLSLAANARDAMPEGGRLTIETQYLQIAEGQGHANVGPGDWMALTIADTGVGMSPQVGLTPTVG
jgi:signal transduction histidine kinase